MPAAARGTGERSAKAFVRYWIETLNYAGPSGDADELNRLSGRACAACTAIIGLIEQVDGDGGYIHGRGWNVRTIETVTFANTTGHVFDALVQVNPQEIRASATDDPSNFQGGRRLKTFWLTRSGDGWVVTRLDQPQ